MDMIEYEYELVNQKVYYEKLDNGLDVYMLPNNNTSNYYIYLNTKYGSKDISFIPINKKEYYNSPSGIAHFLEHKMFDTENDESTFSFFMKTGSSSNAYTSYQSTEYYVSGIKEISSNLDYLLNCIYTPYFTNKTIKNEQGIIKEELEMYEDNLWWKIDKEMRSLLFYNDYLKEDIGGSVESIKKITKEDLYNCYNTFYQPSNMTLIISGNFNPNEVMNVIKKNHALNNHITKMPIVRREYNEPNNVVNEYKCIEDNVIIPRVKYSFKINKNKFSIKDMEKLDLYINTIVDITFGQSSLFKEEVIIEDLATNFYVNYYSYENFYLIEMNAESDKADMLKDKFDKYINNIVIDDLSLERIKKVFKSSEISTSDNMSAMARYLYLDIINYQKVSFNRISIIDSLNINDINTVIKELDLSNASFLLVLPKEKIL